MELGHKLLSVGCAVAVDEAKVRKSGWVEATVRLCSGTWPVLMNSIITWRTSPHSSRLGNPQKNTYTDRQRQSDTQTDTERQRQRQTHHHWLSNIRQTKLILTNSDKFATKLVHSFSSSFDSILNLAWVPKPRLSRHLLWLFATLWHGGVLFPSLVTVFPHRTGWCTIQQ